MNYDNSSVTRQNRTIDADIATALLHSAEWGVLSMADNADGGGYGIPVNYVWDGDSRIYIHCALGGRS